jgi:predicted negative regulator of RcsB-dependent stress response
VAAAFSLRAGRALVALLFIGSAVLAEEQSDPWLGEALYYAHQEEWFEALERLDTEIAQHYRVDERELDLLHPFIGHAEFSVGDFELYYRMHQRAGRAIRAVLEGDVPDLVRNEAVYRLARLQFRKGQPEAALHSLEGIRGRVPAEIRDDVPFLEANLYLATGQASAAVDVLRRLQGSDQLEGFSAYNLGIALLQDGRNDAALAQLQRAGRVDASDRATLAIRDKSNLVLGTLHFESEDFAEAQRSLDRVRLAGPFSNQALLRAGWADASAENFERALVPWNLLAKREATDVAVQEAWLALPYAYGKLDVHGRAATLYQRAVVSYANELQKVDASISNIREGAFLEALVREEIRRDADWVIRLRSLPDAPETFYLMALMASHHFQTSLQNYLDLEDLRRKLVSWQGSLDAFADLITRRRGYYEPQLPEMDSRFRQLDARMRLRLEQRRHLETRLQQLLVAPRPELLATAEEQALAARLDAIDAGLSTGASGPHDALLARAARLRGALTWRLETEYPERLTDAHRHLRELSDDIEQLSVRYDAFVRARQAAAHSYEGYETPIGQLRGRIEQAIERVELLLAQQGHRLEGVAIEELVARRELLETYQNRARFAFADSYDRAAKAQAQLPARAQAH